MVRDHANGYGYDKRTAAVSGCAARILNHLDAPNGSGIARDVGACRAFCAAIGTNAGADWTRDLEDAGFAVLRAIRRHVAMSGLAATQRKSVGQGTMEAVRVDIGGRPRN